MTDSQAKSDSHQSAKTCLSRILPRSAQYLGFAKKYVYCSHTQCKHEVDYPAYCRLFPKSPYTKPGL